MSNDFAICAGPGCHDERYDTDQFDVPHVDECSVCHATPDEPHEADCQNARRSIPALDTIIDPTLAGPIYGAGKVKGLSREQVDGRFNTILAQHGSDIQAATIGMMAEVGMVQNGSAVKEPADKTTPVQQRASDEPEGEEYQ